MNEKLVELIDEDGELKKFIVDAYFDLEDQKYAILLEEETEEGIVMIVKEDEEGIYFESIEDEKELNDIILAYETFIE